MNQKSFSFFRFEAFAQVNRTKCVGIGTREHDQMGAKAVDLNSMPNENSVPNGVRPIRKLEMGHATISEDSVWGNVPCSMVLPEEINICEIRLEEGRLASEGCK